MCLSVCVGVSVYLLMALVVHLLYNNSHYEQITLLDCELHKARASIKTLSFASYTKPVLLSLAKNNLETGLLHAELSCLFPYFGSTFSVFAADLSSGSTPAVSESMAHSS